MASNGLLLFSSDGHPGLGGMDIFVIDPKESDQGYVVNLGQGINSRYDDQGIVFNKGNSKGYMSSNRNGQTKMDIFGIAVVDPEAFIIRCVADIRIRAVNPEQGNGEANVTIRVLNNDSKVVFEDETGPDGIVRIEQPMKKGQYTIKISKEGYEIENQHLILEHDNDRTAIEMAMKQKQIKGEPALAFQRLNLPPVLFAFDSAVITDKGKETLLEIVRFINTYKTVHLKLYGHTDVAGPKGYNAVLSKKRANNALHFLTEQGIEKTRLEAQGMGESQPKTDCRAGDCPPHKNRRVDYRVVDN